MRTFLLFSISVLFLGTRPISAQVIINELDYDQPGVDNAEFVELFNPGIVGVSLDDWTLELVNGANQAAYQAIDLSGFTLAAGGYLVICDAPANVVPCDIDVRPFPDFVNLIEDGITGQNPDPDAVGLKNNLGVLVDRLSYEGDVPGYTETTGTSAVDNDVDTDVSLSRTPNGIDTDNNDNDFQLKCSTPGAINSLDATNCGTLPVELGAFEYTIDNGDVLLAWTTLSEVDVAGFEVQSKTSTTFETDAFVTAVGTSTSSSNYSYTIESPLPGSRAYRLRIVNRDGSSEYSHEIEVEVEPADSYFLSEAYPNPFNPRASVSLMVQQSQSIEVNVYDIMGREVARLYDGTLEAGTVAEFTIDGTSLTSGLYFLRVNGDYFETMRSVVLLK